MEMFMKTLYTPGVAHLSYIFGDGGQGAAKPSSSSLSAARNGRSLLFAALFNAGVSAFDSRRRSQYP